MGFVDIIDAGPNSHENALECLRRLDSLRPDDTARGELVAASQTFALLAVTDALHTTSYTTNDRAVNLADIAAFAADMQT